MNLYRNLKGFFDQDDIRQEIYKGIYETDSLKNAIVKNGDFYVLRNEDYLKDGAGNYSFPIPQTVVNKLFETEDGSASCTFDAFLYYYKLGGKEQNQTLHIRNLKFENHFHGGVVLIYDDKRYELSTDDPFSTSKVISSDYPLIKKFYVYLEKDAVTPMNKMIDLKKWNGELDNSTAEQFFKSCGFEFCYLNPASNFKVDSSAETISWTGTFTLRYPFLYSLKCKGKNGSQKYFRPSPLRNSGRTYVREVTLSDSSSPLPFKELCFFVESMGLYQWNVTNSRQPLYARSDLDWFLTGKNTDWPISSTSLSSYFGSNTALVDNFGAVVSPLLLDEVSSFATIPNYRIKDIYPKIISYDYLKKDVEEKDGMYVFQNQVSDLGGNTQVPFWSYAPTVYPIVIYNELNGITDDLPGQIKITIISERAKDYIQIEGASKEAQKIPFNKQDDRIIVYRRKPLVVPQDEPKEGFVLGNCFKGMNSSVTHNGYTMYQEFYKYRGFKTSIKLQPRLDVYILDNYTSTPFCINKEFDNYESRSVDNEAKDFFKSIVKNEDVAFSMKIDGVRDTSASDDRYLAIGKIAQEKWKDHKDNKTYAGTSSLETTASGKIQVLKHFGTSYRHKKSLSDYYSYVKTGTGNGVYTGWEDSVMPQDSKVYVAGSTDFVKFLYWFSYFTCNPGILPKHVPVFIETNKNGKDGRWAANPNIPNNTTKDYNIYHQYGFLEKPLDDENGITPPTDAKWRFGFGAGYCITSKVAKKNKDGTDGDACFVVGKVQFENAYEGRTSAVAIVLWRNGKFVTETTSTPYPTQDVIETDYAEGYRAEYKPSTVKPGYNSGTTGGGSLGLSVTNGLNDHHNLLK